VEADRKGCVDPRDQAGLLALVRERSADRALLRLLRKWWQAGIRETEGQGIPPETETPQGGAAPVWASSVPGPQIGRVGHASRGARRGSSAMRHAGGARQGANRTGTSRGGRAANV
jgi:hypothetical protein